VTSINHQEIIDIVCRDFGTSRARIRSTCRMQRDFAARAVITMILHDQCQMSFMQIVHAIYGDERSHAGLHEARGRAIAGKYDEWIAAKTGAANTEEYELDAIRRSRKDDEA